MANTNNINNKEKELLQYYYLQKNKKKKYIIVVLIILGILVLAVLGFLFLNLNCLFWEVKAETITVEYGETVDLELNSLVDIEQYSFISADNTTVETDIICEKNYDVDNNAMTEYLDYPEVGEYEIVLTNYNEINVFSFSKEIKTQKKIVVIVEDTTPPEILSTITEIEFDNEEDDEFDISEYSECFSATDLSELNDFEYDYSDVDFDTAGEYIMVVSVSDIYDNTSSLEIKIIVEGNEETTTEEQTTETTTKKATTTEEQTTETTTETTTKKATTTETTTKKSTTTTTTTTKKSSSSSSSSSSKTLSYTKDFLFTDGYTMDTVTDAVLAYVEKKGITSYKYEPLKSNGVYIGMRLYVYS